MIKRPPRRSLLKVSSIVVGATAFIVAASYTALTLEHTFLPPLVGMTPDYSTGTNQTSTVDPLIAAALSKHGVRSTAMKLTASDARGITSINVTYTVALGRQDPLLLAVERSHGGGADNLSLEIRDIFDTITCVPACLEQYPQWSEPYIPRQGTVQWQISDEYDFYAADSGPATITIVGPALTAQQTGQLQPTATRLDIHMPSLTPTPDKAPTPDYQNPTDAVFDHLAPGISYDVQLPAETESYVTPVTSLEEDLTTAIGWFNNSPASTDIGATLAMAAILIGLGGAKQRKMSSIPDLRPGLTILILGIIVCNCVLQVGRYVPRLDAMEFGPFGVTLFVFTAALLPSASFLWFWFYAGRTRPGVVPSWMLATAGVAVLIWAFWAACDLPHNRFPWLAIIVGSTLTIAVFSTTALLALGIWAAPIGCGLGALLLASAVVAEIEMSNFIGRGSASLVQSSLERMTGIWSAVELLWLPTFLAVLRALGSHLDKVVVTCIGVVGTITFANDIQVNYFSPENGTSEAIFMAYAILVPLIALLILRSVGSRARAVSDRLAIGAGVALIAIANGAGPDTGDNAALAFAVGQNPFGVLWPCALVAPLMILLVMRKQYYYEAVRLAAVKRETHRRYVYQDIRYQTIRIGERDYLRKAREKLAGGDITPAEFDARMLLFQATLDEHPRHVLSTRKNALGSLAGSSPWQSGLVGAAIGTVVSVLLEIILDPGSSNIGIIDAYIKQLTTLPLLDIVHLVLVLFPWITYGFIFGYFYPRIEGSDGVSKAAWFGLAVLAPEILRSGLIRNLNILPSEVYASTWAWLLIPIASVAVFSATLGILWEIRLARRANITWTRMRNFQSVNPLMGPATSIAVAAVSAVLASVIH